MRGLIDNPKLENFARAFDTHCGGCRNTCACGREFYDGINSGWSWEPGELEKLEEDSSATCLDCTVSTIFFSGREYCTECDCWHEEALAIIKFIESHAHAIAEWLTLEKKRKIAEAESSPVVEDVP